MIYFNGNMSYGEVKPFSINRKKMIHFNLQYKNVGNNSKIIYIIAIYNSIAYIQ